MSCVEFIFRRTVFFLRREREFLCDNWVAFVRHHQRLTLEPAGWGLAQRIEL